MRPAALHELAPAKPRAALRARRRRHAPAFVLPGAGGAARRARRPAAATRAPTIVSSAGSSVSEASITSSTPIEAEIATPYRKLTPSSIIPSSAITTVQPANSTARPAVSIACTTDSRGSPNVGPGVAYASRKRVRMNSA